MNMNNTSQHFTPTHRNISNDRPRRRLYKLSGIVSVHVHINIKDAHRIV